MPNAPRQMVKPTMTELSGVDHPAHLNEGWLLMKDASPETALMLARAEAIAKGIDPTSVTLESLSSTLDLTKGVAAMPAPLTDEQRAALDPAVAAYIKSVEDREAEAVAKALAENDDTDPDAAAFEKSLAGLPEPVRKAWIAQQRQSVEDRRVIKSLRDQSEDAKFEAMAKQLAHLPGVDTESGNNEFATTMRKAAESNPAAFDGIFKVLKGADAALVESGFYKEIGSSIGGGTDSAAGTVEAIAKAAVAADTTGELTYAEAVSKAAAEHPELYAAHRKEA